MDLREYLSDPEETIRAAVAGLMKDMWTVMPASVSTDSSDGHVATAAPTIKRQVTNADGTVTYEDHPDHPDLPIHHMGGGPVVVTHPTKKGDTGVILYAARAIDSWFNSGGSQQPMEDRSHSLADGAYLSGIRSIPEKLMQVSQESTQTRTVDKRSVIDHGPNGTKIKTADPSTAAASQSFDPYSAATKFFEHLVHPSNGHAANATDGGTTHSVTNTHTDGPKLSAANGAHTVGAHPTNGVGIASTIAHTIGAPNISLDKAGNHSVTGNASVGGSASIKGALSAASGSFGSIGGAGGAAIDLIKAVLAQVGSVQASGAVQAAGPVQGASLQSTMGYLVSNLPAPSNALQGMRVFVTDAVGPTFLAVLQGGGATVCPAFCDGQNWVAG